jgi:integrase/recombinase XerD
MALNKKRLRAVRTDIPSKNYPKLTLQNAVDMVVSGKRTEGVRDRTLRDYLNMWRYFTDWLTEHYNKRRYGNHPLINADNQPIGLKDTTININLRCLRSLFNHLEREELIEVNPMSKVKLLRTDIDLTNSFDEDEVKALFKVPNLRDYVGFRD